MSESYDPDLLLGYVEGTLTPAQQDGFERTLAEDPPLRELVASLTADRAGVSRLIEPPPEGLVEDVMAQLERRMLLDGEPMPATLADAPKAKRITRRRALVYSGVAAALMLGAALLVWRMADVSMVDEAKRVTLLQKGQQVTRPKANPSAPAPPDLAPSSGKHSRQSSSPPAAAIPPQHPSVEAQRRTGAPEAGGKEPSSTFPAAPSVGQQSASGAASTEPSPRADVVGASKARQNQTSAEVEAMGRQRVNATNVAGGGTGESQEGQNVSGPSEGLHSPIGTPAAELGEATQKAVSHTSRLFSNATIAPAQTAARAQLRIAAIHPDAARRDVLEWAGRHRVQVLSRQPTFAPHHGPTNEAADSRSKNERSGHRPPRRSSQPTPDDAAPSAESVAGRGPSSSGEKTSNQAVGSPQTDNQAAATNAPAAASPSLHKATEAASGPTGQVTGGVSPQPAPPASSEAHAPVPSASAATQQLTLRLARDQVESLLAYLNQRPHQHAALVQPPSLLRRAPAEPAHVKASLRPPARKADAGDQTASQLKTSPTARKSGGRQMSGDNGGKSNPPPALLADSTVLSVQWRKPSASSPSRPPSKPLSSKLPPAPSANTVPPSVPPLAQWQAELARARGASRGATTPAPHTSRRTSTGQAAPAPWDGKWGEVLDEQFNTAAVLARSPRVTLPIVITVSVQGGNTP